MAQLEQKVTAASGGAAVSAGGLGLLIAWLVDTFTGVRMPGDVATVVGAIILAALAFVGALAAGWAARSKTSAVSDAFDPAVAQQAQADVAHEKRIADEIGAVDLRTVLIVLGIIVLVLVIISFVDINVRG